MKKKSAQQPAYRTVYQVDTGGKTQVSVVQSEKTGKLYYKKILTIYKVSVYTYLKEHPHPHIPRICAVHERDGKLIVLEELVHGQTLDLALQGSRLNKKQKLQILDDVCSALTFLHSARPYPIIHRDLKPSNILITREGRAVLIDYDAARVFTPGKMRDTELIGTQGNAAPEQYGFGQSDARTDIYALGVLIRELFPRNFRMQRIADRATQINPRDRFSSVEEVREELHRRWILPRKSKPQEYLEYFCTNCGAILNNQPGFAYNDGTWVCTVCGQQLFGDEAGDTGGKLGGVIWYCDGCGAILNRQEGFDYYDDTFVCTQCGYKNDISENNIDPEPPRK